VQIFGAARHAISRLPHRQNQARVVGVGLQPLTQGHNVRIHRPADGAFTTATVTQVFYGISYRVGIASQFTETAIDALVQVNAGRSPPCTFTARWAGPKNGDPNVIP
jgi:hypothetical protein